MAQAVADPPTPSQLDREIGFQRKEWTAQRIGWAAMALVILAGLAGLFGSGPLGDATAASGPLEIAYPRFARKRLPTQVDVAVGAGGIRDGRVAMWLDRAFVDRVDIERVVPEPESVAAAGDRVVYRFAVEPGASGAAIRFDVEPNSPGRWAWRAGLLDGPEIAIGGFVFP